MASSSGHTLFVEPLETIDLNNDLVRLAEEEMRESHRILREITERLRGYSDPIRATLVTMGELELLFAKGRFAVEFDASIPRFGRSFCFARRGTALQDVLRRQGKSVVPVTLELDRELPHAADQRTEYRRKDGDAEDRRAAGA